MLPEHLQQPSTKNLNKIGKQKTYYENIAQQIHTRKKERLR
jgi:hypothetical protein